MWSILSLGADSSTFLAAAGVISNCISGLHSLAYLLPVHAYCIYSYRCSYDMFLNWQLYTGFTTPSPVTVIENSILFCPYRASLKENLLFTWCHILHSHHSILAGFILSPLHVWHALQCTIVHGAGHSNVPPLMSTCLALLHNTTSQWSWRVATLADNFLCVCVFVFLYLSLSTCPALTSKWNF